MLWVAVVLVFLLCQSSAEPVTVKYRCNDTAIDSDVSYTRFYPSLDNEQGRYTAELCTFNNPKQTSLSMDLTYRDDLRYCDQEYRKRLRRVFRPGPQHSSNTANVAGLTNCSHVCYAMDFDLIFSSCYLLKTTWCSAGRTYPSQDSYYLVNNNVTKDTYNKVKPYVVLTNHDDYITLKWILGIPAVDYNVTLRKINNHTPEHSYEDSDVTQNCTLEEYDVRKLNCKLATPYGCYHASVKHGGLWTSGIFNNKKFVTYDWCYRAPELPTLAPRSAALWWACGAMLLCACALLAGVGLRRHLRLRDYHKRVLDFWFNNREVDTVATVTRDSRDVLLLYAREGEHGMQAVAALRDLIQQSTGGTVYDMFSPAGMAALGPAPHGWVRALLARRDVRVLLLQSPAMAALYQDHLCEDEGGLRYGAPLLGRAAVYRAPHYGDQLLKMALRQIAETAHTHQDYHKYYFATYQGLETDILPGVVAYRRYVLPGAAPALASDVAGVAAPGTSALARAVHALRAHVQQHPDYLMDEIFVN